jgi:hypothetical protein
MVRWRHGQTARIILENLRLRVERLGTGVEVPHRRNGDGTRMTVLAADADQLPRRSIDLVIRDGDVLRVGNTLPVVGELTELLGGFLAAAVVDQDRGHTCTHVVVVDRVHREVVDRRLLLEAPDTRELDRSTISRV